MPVRQPIVSVLGHVDHGKTTILDYIRGTSVVQREAGRITQHIGATEVPMEAIKKMCGGLMTKMDIRLPGLLFIDTPGHHSFATLRSRGGSLADMGVLVVDIIEGLKPQTRESIGILKQHKTPFVIALNKIDRLQYWSSRKNTPFVLSLKQQTQEAVEELDTRIYEIIGIFYEEGFPVERYDRITDFTKTVAMVPMSALNGEGVADLLLVLSGIAQRYLEDHLWVEEVGDAEGTVLEVKEEKGFGKTIDVIIHKGILKRGDTVVVGTMDGHLVTRVRGIMRPKPLDEIRDPRDRFYPAEEVSAAAGVKILAPDLEGVVSGASLKTARERPLEEVEKEMEEEMRLHIDLSEEGVMLKADAVGSLEGLAFELREKNISIRKADIGDLSRRDVLEFSPGKEDLHTAILVFNVNVLPDAEEEAEDRGITIFRGDVIYSIVEDYMEWRENRRREVDEKRRTEIVHPGKFKILPGCVFRQSKPAVVGVRILGGRIRSGQGILREDGRVIGKIKSIQSEGKSLKEAVAGQEVAISVDGVTVGRQMDVEDILYVDIPEVDAKKLTSFPLNQDEKSILDEVTGIKRKKEPFWAM